MANIHLENEKCSENHQCSPNILSKNVISNNTQQVCTKVNYTRVKSKDEVFDMNKPKITKTIKTYKRQIIRTKGPNGEYSEQIIEDGDPIIEENIFLNENTNKYVTSAMTGESTVQSSCVISNISKNGEKNEEEFCGSPVRMTLNSQEVNHNFPAGAQVEKIFKQDNSRSIIERATIDGETRLISFRSKNHSVMGESQMKIDPANQESIGSNNQLSNFDVKNIAGDNNNLITEVEIVKEEMKENPGILFGKTVYKTEFPKIGNEAWRSKDQDQKTLESKFPTQPQTICSVVNVPVKIINYDNITPEILIAKNHYNNYTKPIQKIEEINIKTEPTMRVIELSKILNFNNLEKLNILDKELIKEGDLKAFESLQTFPQSLKKQITKGFINIHLIVFRDLVLVGILESPDNILVLEYAERNQTKANSHNSDIKIKKPKNKTILSCVSTKNHLSHYVPEFLMDLKFNKDDGLFQKDSLILSVSKIEERDCWIQAISSI